MKRIAEIEIDDSDYVHNKKIKSYYSDLEHIGKYLTFLVINDDNYTAIDIFERMSEEIITKFKDVNYDIFFINIAVLNDNHDIIKYFMRKGFKFTGWIIYSCVVNDSILCYNLLKNILNNQHYSDYLMELSARSDSIKILSSIMKTLDYYDFDINNLIDISEMMNSKKCLKYLKMTKKLFEN